MKECMEDKDKHKNIGTVTWEEMEAEWERKRLAKKWYNHAWDWIWFKILFHFKWSEIRWNFKRLRCFFVRGKNGWSEIDTWGLEHYLSGVISNSVKHLKDNHYGFPTMILPDNYDSTYDDNEKRKELDDACAKKWVEMLDTISWTFQVNRKISEDKWYLVRREDFKEEDKYNQHLNFCKTMVEKYNEPEDPHHIMTDEEVKRYDEGWELFKKYFFCLWD